MKINEGYKTATTYAANVLLILLPAPSSLEASTEIHHSITVRGIHPMIVMASNLSRVSPDGIMS